MRARRNLSQDGTGWTAWIAIAVAGLLLASAIGLGVYGGRVQPQMRHYEQVVPDDRLAH